MNKKIIALAAPIGAGKSYVANYLIKNYQAENLRYSDTLSEILSIISVEKNRPNLQEISLALREHFGENILEKSLIKKIENSQAEIIIVDGVRRKEDISQIKDFNNFYLIFIDANAEIRASRLQKRNEKTDDQSVTQKILNLEEKHNSETREEELKALADFKIDNNGTLEELEKQINDIMEKIT